MLLLLLGQAPAKDKSAFVIVAEGKASTVVSQPMIPAQFSLRQESGAPVKHGEVMQCSAHLRKIYQGEHLTGWEVVLDCDHGRRFRIEGVLFP